MNLGSVAIGQVTSKGFSIRNSGKGNLLGNIQVLIDPPSRSAVFSVTPNTFNIPPGQSLPESVVFQPDTPVNAALAIISTNDATRPTIGVVLSGSGVAGKLVAPATFTMSAPAGTSIQPSLTIRNTGKGQLSGNWASVMTANYNVTGQPFTIPPGSSTTVPITFSPSVKGNAPSVALAISVISPSTSSTVVTLKGVGK
jgi:hypothetical protein